MESSDNQEMVDHFQHVMDLVAAGDIKSYTVCFIMKDGLIKHLWSPWTCENALRMAGQLDFLKLKTLNSLVLQE